MTKEELKLEANRQKLAVIKETYSQLIPIWSMLDRKKCHLELEMKMLEDERQRLTEGQMFFDSLDF